MLSSYISIIFDLILITKKKKNQKQKENLPLNYCLWIFDRFMDI